MTKILTTIFFITTIILLAFSLAVFKNNTDVSLKNIDLIKDNEAKRQLISASTDVLQECKDERLEWRAYFGGLYGLESARQYYNAPAIDWEEWEEIATSTQD